MEEYAAIADSPMGPLQQEEQGVPQQQAMVRRTDRNAAAYGVDRGRSGSQGLGAPCRQHSRTPYRLPSSDQGNDTVSLVSRQTAQQGGNRDTYQDRASSSQGQAMALRDGMLIGAGRQIEDANAASHLPNWLAELLPQEENNIALALRHAREVREGRPDGSVQLAQQNVQVTVQHPPIAQNGLDGERMQLQLAAVQLPQYQAGL